VSKPSDHDLEPAGLPGAASDELPGSSSRLANPSGKVGELLLGVDEQVEKLRQRVQKIMSDEPSAEVALISAQALEELVVNLREANAHLVIASINAKQLQSKAEASNQLQALFISMLAHELRNPLAPIAMVVELLGKLVKDDARLEHLHGILSRQTGHLTRLVDDLMDVTRINSGKIRIQKTAVQLASLIRLATETTQPMLNDRDQHIEIDLPVDEVLIDGDPVRLTQLFSNLLINASKFSADKAVIRISASVDKAQVAIAIRDPGIGISAELKPRIFELFTQGAAGQGTSLGGLGIGLSLVKTIAEMHGGSVSVQSEGAGLGSEFTVVLPVLSASMAAEAAGIAKAAEIIKVQLPFVIKRVLLIDDNADINRTVSEFLKAAGHTVSCAADGSIALKMVNLHTYDVICCDIGLPGMDGYEVAKQLILAEKPTLARLIAITGYDQADMRERALASGFMHYMVKPIFGNDLLDLIELGDPMPLAA
jgi:signal transduction histidine kinase